MSLMLEDGYASWHTAQILCRELVQELLTIKHKAC